MDLSLPGLGEKNEIAPYGLVENDSSLVRGLLEVEGALLCEDVDYLHRKALPQHSPFIRLLLSSFRISNGPPHK
ncbi:hypothetical protein Ccrd_006017, partial [Cynara cardunculus var. scolymus]